jgi:hypothetical protein
MTTQLNLSKRDLFLLNGACGWAASYLGDMLLRLQERDAEALFDLGYGSGEGDEEEADFLKARESIDSDIQELHLLEHRLFEEIEKLATE